MNYKKIYDQLVEKCRVRGLDKSALEGYYEKHHIVPRCMGGSDEVENLVLFTAREHYVAHILLWKVYPKDSNLFHAAWMMSNRSLQNRNSKLYATLREEHSKILSSRSEFNSPNFKDLTGHVSERLTVIEFAGWTNQAKGKRTSTWSCQCECGEVVVLKAKELNGKGAYKSCGCFKRDQAKAAIGENNHFFGFKHSAESKSKMREKRLGKSPANKGVPMSAESKAKMIESKKLNAVVWTEDRRKEQSERMKGISTRGSGFFASDDTKEKMKTSQLKLDRRAWEFSRVSESPSAFQMWAMADFYWEVWLSADKPAVRKFVSFYNKLFNDEISTGAFNKLILRFKSGWQPLGDTKWEAFREKYDRE